MLINCYSMFLGYHFHWSLLLHISKAHSLHKMKLHFVTGNQKKLSEVQAILGSAVDLENSNLDLVEVQGTIEEVSVAKCRQAALAVS